MRRAALVACLIAVSLSAKVRTKAELAQSEARLRADVAFLTADGCEGRGPNTRGLERAADHVSGRMREIGLTPGFKGGWYQPFGVPGAVGELTLAGPLGQKIQPLPGSGFSVVGHNEAGSAVGSLVFAGYGLCTAEYDDYAGLEVQDRIVVILRGIPRPDRPALPPELRKAMALRSKLAVALRRGARAALVVNDADAAADGDTPPDWSFIDVGARRAPALFVRRALIDKMMPAGKSLAGIERSISRDLRPDSFPLEGWTAALEIKRGPMMTRLKNVIGVLEGNGPLARETVIVGAHYDHLGYGNPDQSLWESNRRAIFHGADDNASGVAGMLELARRFRAVPGRQGRRLVFISFSGEELGLLGSAYYCKNPVFPIADTAAMLNLDMIGRLTNETVWTGGHGTARGFKELLTNEAKKHGMRLDMSATGAGPSDHASFADEKVRVPVLFVWTGDKHPDYHRPTDTADKLNYVTTRRVVDLAEGLVSALTTMERPAYQVVRGYPVKPSVGPRMGLVPADGKEGAAVERVTAGGPADRAGIRAGDVIVAIGTAAVRDAVQYRQTLAAQRHGAEIEVAVLREGKRTVVKVTLD